MSVLTLTISARPTEVGRAKYGRGAAATLEREAGPRRPVRGASGVATRTEGRCGVEDGDLTDAEIIARSRTEPTRFATVFDRHYDAIHRFLWTRVGRRAEDVTAEVFKVAFQQRDRYDPSFPSARPWLFGIASRLAKQQHREEAKAEDAALRSASDPVHAPDASPEQRLDELAPSSPVAAAVMGLPVRDREPLLLHAWDDLSYEEVAHVLDVPVGTVRSRIHRARQVLRSELTPTGEADEPADGGVNHG